MVEIERPGNPSVRHRPAPQRSVGDQLVIARPGDGSAMALSASAAAAWALLTDWCTETELARLFGEQYPSIDAKERRGALTEILRMLSDEGLLERS